MIMSSRSLTALQGPGQTGKTDAPVQLRNRCESAMRGIGYGSRIGRRVASRSSRRMRTGLPPVSSPLCVECTLKLLKGPRRPAILRK